MRRLVILLTVLAAAAGCGDEGNDDTPATRPARPVTLALDFTPNPVHAPVFAAADRGALRIQKPGSGPDGLKLAATGKVELALLDIHDLAIAREQGTDV